MSDQYYYWADEIAHGPHGAEDFVRLITSGVIKPDTLCKRGDMSNYKPYIEIAFMLPAPSRNPEKSTSGIAWYQSSTFGVLAALLILLGIPMVGLYKYQQTPPKSDPRQEAYQAADRFIRDQYPGARSISAIDQSRVMQVGDTARVTVTVDGLNAFGGPVRNEMTVHLRRENGSWKLHLIDQR